MIRASVRGMGVADMTSTWGETAPPFSAKAPRWATPKRCCSSAMTRPRSRYSTPWEKRAWVPTTRSISPAARADSRAFFSFPFTDPVSRATRTPAGARRASMVRACCSASSSVGAIMAHWTPLFAAAQAPNAATAVLPEPTSPWTRRFMAFPDLRSAAMSSMARRWALVGAKGSRAAKSSGPPDSTRPSPADRRSLSWASPQVRTNSSSNTSRRRAMARASKSAG